MKHSNRNIEAQRLKSKLKKMIKAHEMQMKKMGEKKGKMTKERKRSEEMYRKKMKNFQMTISKARSFRDELSNLLNHIKTNKIE